MKSCTKEYIRDISARFIFLVLLPAAILSALVFLNWSAYAGFKENHTDGDDAGKNQISASDRKLSEPDSPIHYVQTNGAWKDLPYSEGTIETYGCGLTAAATYISWITHDSSYTPETLYNAVGDSCLTDGVNDMRKFCKYISDNYPVTCSDQLWDIDDAAMRAINGDCLFASVKGSLKEGHREYGGHIVLIYRIDANGVWIADPGDSTYTGVMSFDRFYEVLGNEDNYFYALTLNK